MENITLIFTTQEISILDQALQRLPYGVVVRLIENINRQVFSEKQRSQSRPPDNTATATHET